MEPAQDETNQQAPQPGHTEHHVEHHHQHHDHEHAHHHEQAAHAVHTDQSAAPTAATQEYQSNPFLVSITGLVRMLTVNPIPSLLLILMLTVMAFGAFMVSFFFLLIPILGVFVFLGILMLIMPIFYGSLASLGVSSIRHETRSTTDYISDSFKKIWTLLGASVLIGLAVFGGLLLFVVPGVIFGLWFSFTYFVIMDENLGAVAAMKRSKELASGHLMEILGAVFASSIMGGMTFGNGGGLLTPIIALSPLVGRYEQIKALKASNQPKPEVHWANYILVIFCSIFVVLFIVVYSIMIAAGIYDSNSNYNRNRYNKPTYQQNNNFDNFFNDNYSSPRYQTN